MAMCGTGMYDVVVVSDIMVLVILDLRQPGVVWESRGTYGKLEGHMCLRAEVAMTGSIALFGCRNGATDALACCCEDPKRWCSPWALLDYLAQAHTCEWIISML